MVQMHPKPKWKSGKFPSAFQQVPPVCHWSIPDISSAASAAFQIELRPHTSHQSKGIKIKCLIKSSSPRTNQLSSVKEALLRVMSQRTKKVVFSHKKKKKGGGILLFYTSYSRRRLRQYLPAAVSDCHALVSCLKCLGYRASREVL